MGSVVDIWECSMAITRTMFTADIGTQPTGIIGTSINWREDRCLRPCDVARLDA
jgi:hypothetical protein